MLKWYQKLLLLVKRTLNTQIKKYTYLHKLKKRTIYYVDYFDIVLTIYFKFNLKLFNIKKINDKKHSRNTMLKKINFYPSKNIYIGTKEITFLNKIRKCL